MASDDELYDIDTENESESDTDTGEIMITRKSDQDGIIISSEINAEINTEEASYGYVADEFISAVISEHYENRKLENLRSYISGFNEKLGEFIRNYIRDPFASHGCLLNKPFEDYLGISKRKQIAEYLSYFHKLFDFENNKNCDLVKNHPYINKYGYSVGLMKSILHHDKIKVLVIIENGVPRFLIRNWYIHKLKYTCSNKLLPHCRYITDYIEKGIYYSTNKLVFDNEKIWINLPDDIIIKEYTNGMSAMLKKRKVKASKKFIKDSIRIRRINTKDETKTILYLQYSPIYKN